MQTAACPGCGANLGVPRLREFRPGYAACNCGAVLGAGADIVVRESDGKAVFDPGAKIETPPHFVTARGESSTKGGYRDNAATSHRTSMSISFPLPRGGHVRYGALMMVCVLVVVMAFPFAVNEWAVTRLAVVVAALASLPALYFLFLTAAYSWNRTTISCADGYLRVRSSPVPLASEEVRFDDIDSVFCERFTNVENDFEFFGISTRRTSGAMRPLVKRFEDLDQALHVVRAVRTALKLEPGGRPADATAAPARVRFARSPEVAAALEGSLTPSPDAESSSEAVDAQAQEETETAPKPRRKKSNRPLSQGPSRRR